MIKKLALGVVTLGLLFSASSGWTCIGIGDSCDVEDMTSIEYGYDIKVDVDVCIDAGNLQGWFGDDFWSARAVILQDGGGNDAGITQRNSSQLAGIVQDGCFNDAWIDQYAANEYALIIQEGKGNDAGITQTMQNTAALIIQNGWFNDAWINQ